MLQAYQALWDYRDKPLSLANRLNIWNSRIAASHSKSSRRHGMQEQTVKTVQVLLRHFLQDSPEVNLSCVMPALLLFADQTAVTLTELP